jgi:lysophospholipase L1-like esterase
MGCFQLAGDSILKRLFNKFPQFYDGKSAETCISGCTVSELRHLLKSKCNIEQYLIVMIGCNDLMKGKCVANIERDLKALIKFLSKKCTRIILCEILPFSNSKLQVLNQNVKALNQFLHSFAGVSGVQVLNLYGEFSTHTSPDPSCYCAFYNDGRLDGVHPSDFGLSIIHNTLIGAFESHYLG